ncbi:MAG: glycosyltransferase family 2 protein [Odoribacter sp.]
MYKVSVIIPVYNVEKYVGYSLQSVLNQTYKNIEYIIVDDCSPDGSMDIIQEMLLKHPRQEDVLIVRHEKNRGLSAARNTGLGLAHGEFVFFMDSDDKLTTNCIELHVKALLKSGADFTVANMEICGSKSVHNCKLAFDVLKERDILKSFFERKWSGSACNKLICKKIIEDYSLQFEEGKLHEDILWSYQLALNACCVVGVNENTYQYIIRGNSITTTLNSKKKIDSYLFTIRQIADSVLQLEDERLINSAKSYLTFLRFIASLLLTNCKENWKEKEKIYRQLNGNGLDKLNNCSLFSLFLSMPYALFYVLLYLPYRFYKYSQKLF